jgi:hypothetical protein
MVAHHFAAISFFDYRLYVCGLTTYALRLGSLSLYRTTALTLSHGLCF